MPQQKKKKAMIARQRRPTPKELPFLYALAAGFWVEEHPIPGKAVFDTRDTGISWMSRRTLDAFVRRGWVEQTEWSKKNPNYDKCYAMTPERVEAIKRASCGCRGRRPRRKRPPTTRPRHASVQGRHVCTGKVFS